MACDMPEPCKFQAFEGCQKRFLWTHKEVDLASHPLTGLVHHCSLFVKCEVSLSLMSKISPTFSVVETLWAVIFW